MKMGPYLDFESASRSILEFLHGRLGFDLWMVTRTDGTDCVVLLAEDHGYGVKEGAVFNWADSFCSRMVLGGGPFIAPSSDDVPAYATAPLGKKIPVGAYIGLPLADAEGALFGTLCAIAPSPQPEELHGELPLLQLLSKLLSSLLASELQLTSQVRRAEIATKDTLTDAVTGLLNQSSWHRIVNAEERRCKLYGYPACIIAIRVDGLNALDSQAINDSVRQLATRVGDQIRAVLVDNDSAARIQGGDFLLMGAERNAVSGQEWLDQLKGSLQSAGIVAKMGFASRNPQVGLRAAIDLALHSLGNDIGELPWDEID